MKNSTFFKIALLIILSGLTYHVVTPKYVVKNVSYRAGTIVSGQEPYSTKEDVLIRIDRITGKIEQFLSTSYITDEKMTSHSAWIPLADESEHEKKPKT